MPSFTIRINEFKKCFLHLEMSITLLANETQNKDVLLRELSLLLMQSISFFVQFINDCFLYFFTTSIQKLILNLWEKIYDFKLSIFFLNLLSVLSSSSQLVKSSKDPQDFHYLDLQSYQVSSKCKKP